MEVLNNKMQNLKHFFSKNRFDLLLLAFSIILFAIIMVLIGSHFFVRLSVELCQGFKDDGGIYYTVGKGIVHGLRPYVDMYETKGPVLFYLCALAYLISPDFYFMNVLSFLSLITIIIAPLVVITFKFVKCKNPNWLLYSAYIFSFFPLGMLLAAYAQNMTGRIYAEMFGLEFLIVYLTIIYIVDSKKTKLYSPTIIISGCFLMLSMFTKETFIPIAIVTSLFICKNKKDFIYKFFVPFLYAGIIAIVFMACAGILPAYFNIYLKSMLERRIELLASLSNAGVSALPNMFRVDIIILDMWNFSGIMTIVIMISFAASYYWLFSQPYAKLSKKSSASQIVLRTLNVLRRFLLMLAIFFVATFCLSLGTMSWGHQKAVGMPVYVLLLFILFDVIYSIKQIKLPKFNLKINSIIPFSLTVLTCFGIFALPKITYESRTFEEKNTVAKIQAQYVDQICDALNEDRYQYLGMIGDGFYAYTRHDEMGPAFVQTPPMMAREDNYLCRQFVIQLHTVNVIFFRKFNCGAINDWVKYYVTTHFTTEVPEQCKNIEVPDVWTGKTYFRIGKFN